MIFSMRFISNFLHVDPFALRTPPLIDLPDPFLAGARSLLAIRLPAFAQKCPHRLGIYMRFLGKRCQCDRFPLCLPALIDLPDPFPLGLLDTFAVGWRPLHT